MTRRRQLEKAKPAMSEDVSTTNEPFDLEKLKALVELMEAHSLTEVSLRRGDEQWCLRRSPQEVMQMVPANPYATAPAPNSSQAATPPPAAEPEAEEEEETTVQIKSPTVGTFYAASSPDDPAFVEIGSKVQPDTVVCIVEAMKVFNQIPAEVNGTIVDILVKSGDPVEFGQPLFLARPG